MLFWIIYWPFHTYYNAEIPISDYSDLLNHPFCIETAPLLRQCAKDGIVTRKEYGILLLKDQESKDLINKQAFIDEAKAR